MVQPLALLHVYPETKTGVIWGGGVRWYALRGRSGITKEVVVTSYIVRFLKFVYVWEFKQFQKD